MDLIYLCYPNNPTGAAETGSMYEEVLEFARKYDLLIVSDIAYVELNLDPGYRSMSFLELPGAKERTIEFYSFSKTYSMPGWRIGFAGLGLTPAGTDGGWYQPNGMMLLAPSAFFLIGLIIWGIRAWKPAQVEKREYQIKVVHRTEAL